MDPLAAEIARRRTFAIISHPDAGKTTLTEKLLLFGGAIQLAGEVKARGERRRVRSDWMDIERERGISVSSAVMTFEHEGLVFNLLDTPGHQDFSEDTYRTLTAVDSAVMVLDAAKGIEAQTLKLFEVCRLRDVPIVTFVNKLDREGRDPFDLMDEIERQLALEATPASWPIGMGRDFLGTYDLFADTLLLFARGGGERVVQPVRCTGLDDPRLGELLPAAALRKLREDVTLVRGLCPPFNLESYRQGHLTPVFFGSALNNFGVRELLRGIAELAPSPRPQPALPRAIDPAESKVTGFVFKVQANIDPQHRDRVAFLRLCSGRFRRGMKLKHSRSGRMMSVQNPVFFLARERNLAEVEASAPRAGAACRGRRHPHLQAAGRRRLDHRRRRRAAARSSRRAHQERIRAGRAARAGALRNRALDRWREGRARALRRRQPVDRGRGPRQCARLSRAQCLGPKNDHPRLAGLALRRHARAVVSRAARRSRRIAAAAAHSPKRPCNNTCKRGRTAR